MFDGAEEYFKEYKWGLREDTKANPFIRDLIIETRYNIKQVLEATGMKHRSFYHLMQKPMKNLRIEEAVEFAYSLCIDPDTFHYLLHKHYARELEENFK